MTTQLSKYHITVYLHSNYESNYKYNLDEIWETVKTHYEDRVIPNVNVSFVVGNQDDNDSYIYIRKSKYFKMCEAHVFYDCLVLYLNSDTTTDALIQNIAQFIDKTDISQFIDNIL